MAFVYKIGSWHTRRHYSYFAPLMITVKVDNYISFRQKLPKRIDGRFMANLSREQRIERLSDLLFLARSNREENVRQLSRGITKKFRQQNHSNRSKMDIII